MSTDEGQAEGLPRMQASPPPPPPSAQSQSQSPTQSPTQSGSQPQTQSLHLLQQNSDRRRGHTVSPARSSSTSRGRSPYGHSSHGKQQRLTLSTSPVSLVVQDMGVANNSGIAGRCFVTNPPSSNSSLASCSSPTAATTTTGRSRSPEAKSAAIPHPRRKRQSQYQGSRSASAISRRLSSPSTATSSTTTATTATAPTATTSPTRTNRRKKKKTKNKKNSNHDGYNNDDDDDNDDNDDNNNNVMVGKRSPRAPSSSAYAGSALASSFSDLRRPWPVRPMGARQQFVGFVASQVAANSPSNDNNSAMLLLLTNAADPSTRTLSLSPSASSVSTSASSTSASTSPSPRGRNSLPSDSPTLLRRVSREQRSSRTVARLSGNKDSGINVERAKRLNARHQRKLAVPTTIHERLLRTEKAENALAPTATNHGGVAAVDDMPEGSITDKNCDVDDERVAPDLTATSALANSAQPSERQGATTGARASSLSSGGEGSDAAAAAAAAAAAPVSIAGETRSSSSTNEDADVVPIHSSDPRSWKRTSRALTATREGRPRNLVASPAWNLSKSRLERLAWKAALAVAEAARIRDYHSSLRARSLRSSRIESGGGVVAVSDPSLSSSQQHDNAPPPPSRSTLALEPKHVPKQATTGKKSRIAVFVPTRADHHSSVSEERASTSAPEKAAAAQRLPQRGLSPRLRMRENGDRVAQQAIRIENQVYQRLQKKLITDGRSPLQVHSTTSTTTTSSVSTPAAAPTSSNGWSESPDSVVTEPSGTSSSVGSNGQPLQLGTPKHLTTKPRDWRQQQPPDDLDSSTSAPPLLGVGRRVPEAAYVERRSAMAAMLHEQNQEGFGGW